VLTSLLTALRLTDFPVVLTVLPGFLTHGDRFRHRPGPAPVPTTRRLVVVLIETGLRGGDACTLPFNPVLDDSADWPCLRFEAVKVRASAIIPDQNSTRRT